MGQGDTESAGNLTFFCRRGNENVGSRTPHRMFVVDLERAAASSWYGQDDVRCTGPNEERCCLYWAAIGPVRPGGLEATRALS
jgi:hypothetical protein